MIDIQNLVNMISDTARDVRKDYHVCLGDFLSQLRDADPEATIPLANPHSYRGYYSDLALEPVNGAPIKVWQLINQLSDVIDTELTGYKGGEFMMSADTPIWVANHGCTGAALVGFDPRTLTILTKDTK